MVVKEMDDELTLFLEMQKREKEKEINNLLHIHNSNDSKFDAPLGSKPDESPISKIVSSMPLGKSRVEEFLNSENEKTDYDWLLTPPSTPLFPSLERESQKVLMGQKGSSNTRPTTLRSRLSNLEVERATMNEVSARHGTLTSGLTTSNVGARIPPSSGMPTSTAYRSATPSRMTSSTAQRSATPSRMTSSTAQRSATPTGRSSLPAAIGKPSRATTPSSRPTFPSPTSASTSRPSTPTGRPNLPAAVKAARSSTPTSRSILPSTKPSAPQVRSSTPTRSTPRSSIPTARLSVPAPKSVSRSRTPTRQPSNSLSAPIVSVHPARSSSVTNCLKTLHKPVLSRGSSPTVKSRPSKTYDFSLDAPPNLRTSMPERPVSASRGRLGALNVPLSVEGGRSRRTARQSCSPSRGKISKGSAFISGGSAVASMKAHSSGSDNISPVLVGTKMVERVVNMRKLAPPKQDDHCSTHSNPGLRSTSSPTSSGFGLMLSKKSLDMAMRHMDIRRSSENLHPLITNIPASSMYSVRLGSTKGRTNSDSPLATSSSAGSEPSVNNNFIYSDGNNMEDNDLGSEICYLSPASQACR